MEEVIGFTIKLKDLTSSKVKTVVNALNLIPKTLRSITKRAFEAERSMMRFLKKSSKGAAQLSRTLSGVSIALNDAARSIATITNLTAGTLARLALAGIKTAADYEASGARLGFALAKINRPLEDTKKRIDEISLSTTLTRKAVTDMVTSLALMKVDAFDQAVSKLSVTMQDGSKETVSALEVMNDAVAFSGKNSARIIRGIREAVSERKIRTGRFLSEDLELGGKELDKWNAALKKSKSEQEAFNAVMELMAERVGGITKSVEHTLNFVLLQIEDWRDKLADDLFRDALPLISKFIRDIGKEFIRMTQSDHFKPIREAITDTMRGVLFLAKGFVFLTRTVIELFRAFPFLVPLLTAVSAIMAAIGGVAIVVAALLAPLLAFGGLVTLMPAIILGLKAALVPMIAIGVALSVIVGLLAVVAGAAAIFMAMFVGASSVTEFFERWKVLITAVVEGVRALNGETTRLSLETAASLERHGLKGQFLLIMRLVVKLKRFFVALKDEVVKSWPKIVQAMRPAIESLIRVGRMFGTEMNLSPTNDDLGSWENWGTIVGKVLGGVITLMGQLFAMTVRFMTFLAEKAMGLGMMSADEFARIMGAPEEFFKLDKDIRHELVTKGTFTDQGMIRGGFNAGSDDVTHTSTSTLDPTHRQIVGPALEWARRMREGDAAMVDHIMGSLTGQPTVNPNAPTQSMSLQGRYDSFGAAQQAIVRQAMADRKITPEEAKIIGQAVSEAFAKQLQANPMALKVDREALAESVEAEALASYEEAS